MKPELNPLLKMANDAKRVHDENRKALVVWLQVNNPAQAKVIKMETSKQKLA